MNDEPLLKKPRLASSDRVKLLKQAEADPASFIADRGLELVGEWLEQAVSTQETGLVHACLGCLEKLPMTLDLLQASKIGRLVNESMKPCGNQVAVERARKLLNGWKLIVGGATETKKVEVMAPPPTTKKAEIVEEQNPKEIQEEISQEPPKESVQEDDNAVDALASLLESLPDIEALIDAVPGKRGIKWKPDSQLVQMVEFGILETCEDLRCRIDETHGGLSSLHPHGQDTAEEIKRFQESRKKERAMGGNRLRMQLLIDEDDAEDLEVFLPTWVWPMKVRVLAQDAVYDPKKVMSYERQDLADMHGARPEVIYGPRVKIPDTPSEPSNSFKLQRNETIEVLLGGSGEEPIDLEPAAPSSGQSIPGPGGSPSDVTSFDDEFVKLDSKLQTVILGSEDLLQLFMRDPSLLRGLTAEKLELITSELRKPPLVPKPVSHTVPPHVDDRKGWGTSTIRTAVRQEVMSSFVQPPPGPGYPYPPPPAAFPGPRGIYEPPHMQRGSPPTYNQQGAFPHAPPPFHHGYPPPDYGYNRGPPQHAPPPDYGYNRGPPPTHAPPQDYGYSRGPPQHGPPPHEYGYNRGPPPNAPPAEYGYNRGPPPPHAPAYPPRRSPRR